MLCVPYTCARVRYVKAQLLYLFIYRKRERDERKRSFSFVNKKRERERSEARDMGEVVELRFIVMQDEEFLRNVFELPFLFFFLKFCFVTAMIIYRLLAIP